MTQTAGSSTGADLAAGSRAKTVYYVFEDVSDNLTTWEFRGVQEAYNTDQARREFAGESGGCFVAVAASNFQPVLATVKTTVSWSSVDMPALEEELITVTTVTTFPAGAGDEADAEDFFGAAS